MAQILQSEILNQLFGQKLTAQEIATATGQDLVEVQATLDILLAEGDVLLDTVDNTYSLDPASNRVQNDPAVKDELEDELARFQELFECDLSTEIRAKLTANGLTAQNMRDVCYLLETFPPLLMAIATEKQKSDQVDCIDQVFASAKQLIQCLIELSNG